MPISYPLSIPAYPTAAGIERISFTHIHSVALLRSPWSFATQTQDNQGKMFGVEVTIAPCKRAQAAPWIAFLASLKGPFGTFLLPVEKHAQAPMGVATGTPLVFGSRPSGFESIQIDGWTAGVTNILQAGDYLQIGNRLYQVLQDANSNGSGFCEVEVFPSVRETLADNAAVITSNPKGLFRLDSSEVATYETDKERLYNISFTAVEAI